MRGSGASLQLRGLGKHYGSHQVLRDVDLDVGRGEFVTLLGPSGSGKTTTLNLVAGFVDPTRGSIRLDGEDLAGVPPNRRGIGVVFQSYALFPHMTVHENVAFPLQQRRPRPDRATIDRRVAEALRLVRMEGFAQRMPDQLSGGQQQRVALARAVVFEPKLLLLDEPLGALDKRLREALQLELRRIHRELGVTIVFVTHDQDEALTLSDRIVVFRDGAIEQIGAPRELYRHPRTEFVATFLGDSNVLAGTGDGSRMVVDGHPIRAEREVPAGAAKVMVRPENVAVDARSPDDDGANAMRVDVTDVIFSGPSIRVEGETAGGLRLLARVSSLAHGVEIGRPAWFAWAARDTRLLDEAGS
jgi:putative spermidine/putrescine transport system ATP-binding protein